VTAQSRKLGKKAKRRDWERRLGPYLDWVAYLACAALVVTVVWLATTRSATRVSFAGTSSEVLCNLAPLPTVSRGAEPIEYPHLHASADALIVTGTTLRFASDGDGASDAEVFVPKSPQATAVIKFSSRYTVRLFMHKGYALGLMPGGDVPLASTKPWSTGSMPSEYTIAFQFHYHPEALLWKVVGIENVKLSVMTSGFDQDRTFEKPTGKRLEISGFPHPFQDVPVALGCCSSEWPPLIGQSLTLSANGETADYVPMLFVNIQANPGAELVEAEPLMCERVSLDGAVGSLSVGGVTQSVDNPVPLSFNGYVEVRPTTGHQRIKYALTGTAKSIIVSSQELVPTKLGAIGPFWAGLLSTVAAALVIALVATKGRMIQRWLRE
jgi:hypothetical protein